MTHDIAKARLKKLLEEMTSASKQYRIHPTEWNRLALKKAQRELLEAAQNLRKETA